MGLSTKGMKDYTKGPIFSEIIKFSLPLMATMLLQQLFNTVDTVMVGRWGGSTVEAREAAIAAVGACGSLINLIINFSNGFAVGAGVCVSHDIGAKRYEDIKKTVYTSIYLALICSVVIMSIGIPLARYLLILTGMGQEVLEEAVPYIRAYFLGVPALLVYNYCATILRSLGDTSHSMVYLIIGGVSNVVMNTIMIMVFKLGAMGVGIATAFSQWLSVLLMLRFMIKSDGLFKINFREMKIYPQKLKKILQIGIPSGLQSTVFSFSNVMLQSSINSFGKIVMAGDAAAANIVNYVYFVINTFHYSALSFAGQNYGAKKYDRIIKSLWLSNLGALIFGSIAAAVVTVFGKQLLLIYLPGNVYAITSGMRRINLLAFAYLLCGFMDVGCGTLRGLGKTTAAMIISIAGVCGIRLIWIFTVFKVFYDYQVLLVSYPVSWVITALTYYIVIYSVINSLKKEIIKTKTAVL